MFNKKVKKEDLAKLQKLSDLLGNNLLICQSLELKKRVLTKEVDLRTGKITEIKS